MKAVKSRFPVLISLKAFRLVIYLFVIMNSTLNYFMLHPVIYFKSHYLHLLATLDYFKEIG